MLEEIFRLKEREGEDKVIPLPQAIGKHIKPGMKLYFTEYASAALLELIRAFWGKNPQFTLITSVFTGYDIITIHAGLVKEIITSNCTHMYPSPSPISLIHRAKREGKVRIEDWSSYTLQQRLMAGALGLSFLPTQSISGSNMAEENRGCFKEIDDPFNQGKIGVIKSLVPDVSLVHGLVSDPYGNTILPAPYHELWGARAGRKVLVTVEKVVDTDFIRGHSSLVKLPGYLVSSISPAPWGAHPWCLFDLGLEGVEGYEADFEFMSAFHQAAESPHFMEWVKEWVLDLPDHTAYLTKLGKVRLSLLKQKAKGVSQGEEIDLSAPYTAAEVMIISAARKMIERIKENGYKVILAGIGTGALAAWLAYYLLHKEGYHVDLTIGTGEVGFSPRPGEPPVIATLSHIATAKMLTDSVETYGFIVGGRRNLCLASLGAAQIDKRGNVNSTQIGDVRLTGSGGANDAVNSREAVVVLFQSPRRFVERVAYITCPGERIKTVISQLGIFEKEGGELVLTAFIPQNKTPEETIKHIKENCGWDLKIKGGIKGLPPPTKEELFILRALDPHRFYIQ